MLARVLKSTGSNYILLNPENHEVFNARLRGKLRLKGSEKTNPVAVGDLVSIERDKTGEWLIVDVSQRSNYIIRKSVNLSHRAHIVASNIDLAVLVVSMSRPATSPGFADRFLMVCEAYHIPASIFINKADVMSPAEQELAGYWKELYGGLGYEVMIGSALKDDLSDFSKLINDRIILLAGHSGVGKSTILNHINPSSGAKTADISNWSNKGKHTTTFAEMHRVNEKTWIIDTPGIKEFGIVGFEKDEIGQYFVEIRKEMGKCRFNNCSHINEPGCAVIAAVEEGMIAPTRYQSYCSIYFGEDMHQ